MADRDYPNWGQEPSYPPQKGYRDHRELVQWEGEDFHRDFERDLKKQQKYRMPTTPTYRAPNQGSPVGRGVYAEPPDLGNPIPVGSYAEPEEPKAVKLLILLQQYALETKRVSRKTTDYDVEVVTVLSHRNHVDQKGGTPCKWATVLPPYGNAAQLFQEILKHEKEFHGKRIKVRNEED